MEIADAMLMAAGLGTRLRPFTDVCPKPVLPLLDVPMAQFAIDSLIDAGVSRLVANVHYQAQLVEKELRRLDYGAAVLRISDESDLLLGSAGGIRKALPEFKARPFFLVNSDVLMDLDLRELARAHARLRARFGVHLTLAVLANPPAGGSYREIRVDSSSGLVTAFGDVVQGRPFFSGAAILETEALQHVPEGPAEFRETILAPAIAAGKAGAYVFQGLWKDVGSPELWHEAHFDLLDRLETGALSPRLRRRLDLANRRKAQKVWVSRRAPLLYCHTNWEGPCYWAPGGASALRTLPPRQMGPNAVLYGAAPDSLNAAPISGIGYDGKWQRVGEEVTG